MKQISFFKMSFCSATFTITSTKKKSFDVSGNIIQTVLLIYKEEFFINYAISEHLWYQTYHLFFSVTHTIKLVLFGF